MNIYNYDYFSIAAVISIIRDFIPVVVISEQTWDN